MTYSPGRVHRAAGAEAMVAASVVMIVLRLVFGVVTLPELLSDTVIYLIPATIFSTTLDLLRSAAKPLLLIILFASQIGVGALVGGLLGSLVPTPMGPSPFAAAFRLTIVPTIGTWLVTVVIVMPALGAGILGVDSTGGAALTSAGYLVTYTSYAVTFAWLAVTLPQRAIPVERRSGTTTRRQLLRPLGVGLVLLVGASAGLKWVSALAPLGKPHNARIPSPLTPVDQFYVVSKNLLGTTVDLGRWRINLIGSGARKAQLDLQDLKAMPSVELTSTLTCISNFVGGDLIGTARWTGVRLRDLIGLPSPAEGIREVVLTGWDDYSDSIPIDRAIDPQTVLVYAIDGQPLPPEHGYPVRLIVPGLYGIKNVKWIKRIEVVGHGFVGYWAARGWTDRALVQTQSQIDLPLDRASFPVGTVVVGGIAFAGDRGISQVELSIDGGKSWNPTVLTPPLSPFSWTPWSWTWQPASPGNFPLAVRATDGQGTVQGSAETPPIPDGATGYHRITVRIA